MTYKFYSSFALFLVLLVLFVPQVTTVPFHRDESQWIASSDSFEAFVTLRWRDPVWQVSYWTLTQPPVARYFIGVGRLTGGFTTNNLNEAWNFKASDELNVAQGRMPSTELLWWSRSVMAVLAACCGVLLWIILLDSAGWLAATVSVALFALNPYTAQTLLRAMGDAPLLCFLLLTVWCSMKARGPKPTRWLIVASICAALATSSKLNGLSILAVPVAVSLLGPRVYRLRFLLIVTLTYVAVFIAINPFLWPNVGVRTAAMFAFRVKEARDQRIDYPHEVIPGNLNGISFITRRVLETHAALPWALVNGAFTALGLVFLFRRCSLLLLVAIICTTLPSFLAPMDWERYYLFPVTWSTVLTGCGAVWIASLIWQRMMLYRQNTLTNA